MMGLGLDARTMTRTLCLVAAPLVALGLVRVLAPLPSATQAGTVKKSEQQARALLSLPPEFWRSAAMPPASDAEALAGSPFYLPTPLDEVVADAALTPALPGETPPTLLPPAIMVPNLRLTSILLVGERQMAIIDGTTVRVGDQVAAGWILASIDGRSQTIVVRHSGGSEQVFGIWRSEPGRP